MLYGELLTIGELQAADLALTVELHIAVRVSASLEKSCSLSLRVLSVADSAIVVGYESTADGEGGNPIFAQNK